MTVAIVFAQMRYKLYWQEEAFMVVDGFYLPIKFKYKNTKYKIDKRLINLEICRDFPHERYRRRLYDKVNYASNIGLYDKIFNYLQINGVEKVIESEVKNKVRWIDSQMSDDKKKEHYIKTLTNKK